MLSASGWYNDYAHNYPWILDANGKWIRMTGGIASPNWCAVANFVGCGGQQWHVFLFATTGERLRL